MEIEKVVAFAKKTGYDTAELDIKLLKHELVELTQMKRHGYDYDTAHKIANMFHNWEEALNKKKGKL